MAVQASLVWPKIDQILEFADFSDRFFPYHPVVPWNGRETLPATQGPQGSVSQYLSNPQLRPPYASQEYIMSFEKPCLTCTYEVELFAR